MNKEKFLEKLREYLSILENQEQEDVLAEYSQHIDMKMQKGLSEEEAIRDFGPIEQLATEILEAYHVKAEFHKKSTPFRIGKPKAGGQIKEAWTKVVHKIGQGFQWIGVKCRTFAKWCSKPFTRRKARVDESIQEKYMQDKQKSCAERKGTEEMGRMEKFFGAIGRGIVSIWKWFVEFCVFLLKFMWNAAWLVFAIFCAGMAMVILMGVGAIPIFLAQGYPFIGIFIICIGGLLCLGAMAYGAFGMLIRRSNGNRDRNNGDEYQEKAEKEAAYEQTT
ncbi:MAG: DUF1700 domain-containing protein [Eubacterium sp.]|nr:DUF1700 domain-containing protein [Eubacterium sp.]